ncbi:adenylate kinase [Planctopirus limnophila DSM 3776]|jgi:adenylate kinase|uniref:Adenylate kinase n=3 Tax=Planctopirus TaxID=1649480 RepID=D5SRP5_PLAL2|nr:adenylate kinase [Planctopirus limnophila DSM 3776]QDV29767.1 Adenylate kinase [Planctopirus ephydatiae]
MGTLMSDDRYPTILLFGAPGVGKGTQGTILGQIPGFFHLACGDVFRSLNIRSPEGREIYDHSSRGELVPDELTVRVWNKALLGHIAVSRFRPPEEILILDGIPRTVTQAEILNSTINVLKVIHLICADHEQMIDRIKRRAIRENRADDASEEVIRRRFEVYRRESDPVINCYDSDKVAFVDALQRPSKVLSDILQILIPVQADWLKSLDETP